MIQKLLIANRGEIARRIIRTAHRMGIETVALCTRAELYAPHVQEAGEYVVFDSDNLQETFLNAEKIIAVCHQVQADAIHPGYGFLSENAEFAQKVIDANIVFVGPSPHSIAAMGNKLNAAKTANVAGVPVQKIFRGTTKELAGLAETLTYPVILKAASGGGGKGMQKVKNSTDYLTALSQTAREAQSYFRNSEIYVEQYLENARHIEVQIFGDGTGHVIHLGERDCTLQRRHQKIIEEAPATILTDEQRKKVTEYAILLGKKMNYKSAGTVEFLLDQNGQFHFLEMNTRIQVEHPVTEAITNVDIVQLQLAIAGGAPLTLQQNEVAFDGHAIEIRLYAEKPAQNFLPDAGPIHYLQFPRFDGLRVESSIEKTGFAHPNYDPMLAKLIVKGTNRIEAIQKITKTLKNTYLAGVQNNIAHLTQIVQSNFFIDNNFTTTTIETKNRYETPKPNESHFIATMLLISASSNTHTEQAWNTGYYRQVKPEIMLQCNNINQKVRIRKHEQSANITMGNQSYEVKINDLSAHQISFSFSRKPYRFHFHKNKNSVWLFDNGQTYRINQLLPRSNKQTTSHTEGKQSELVSPMFGKILKIATFSGAHVKAGDTLLIIESMKMENHLQATGYGKVKTIFINEGEQISDNQLLIKFE
ncbi:MAG: ATP-grasp domain-containing protein [Salinivirgaceae bacterium]|jgi:acetyl/propionyl-CoA carboxylase alpha subunit|nr:ATP-grasp domain-containing protein [Salinivirgaceae bacterium]